MTTGKFIILVFQKFSKRKLHGTTYRSSNLRDLMKKELESCNSKKPEENDPLCIYKVPPNMHRVEPKAYTPNNISIGPYHHGARHLQNMERLKKKFYRRLFDPNNDANGAKLDEACKFLEEQESKIRRCYMDNIKLSSDEFLKMMLVDGAFIVHLLRGLSMCEFRQVPCLSRWMIPIIRRELIMLENQLPLFVLRKLFELTSAASPRQPQMSFEAIALRFFYPLLLVDSDNFPECERVDELRRHHILDLLRSSISPKINGENPRETQRHMVYSTTELMEAGVKIKGDEKRQLLDISLGKKWGFVMTELTIPRLNINDHRGTVFRNMVAFEKCHKKCEPDVTTYLFFFNGLINSPQDVALLHYKGVLHHSLGNNKTVSKLINNITKEITRDKNESYLHKVVNDVNLYYNSLYARLRVSLVHHYLTSWVVGVSTIAALFVLYSTFIQTVFDFASALEALENKSFRTLSKDAFLIRVRGTSTNREVESSSEDAATKSER